MYLDVETVVKQLADSGVVAPGKLENFVPPNAHPQSVDEFLAELVKSANLTDFQAAQVKAGQAKTLVLGNYTIRDHLGAGGMGQVFKAEHRRMKRLVAIKMLPPAMTKDPVALARFQREVVAAARLDHPNIVTAHDADQAGSVHFLVMQYVDGRDLSALVKKNGPLPVAKAVNYILQAARGIEYAHAQGVIHRDIKPGNLLLGTDGVVKILDMGLARIESGLGSADAELTGSGTIMGTVDFMAPEQGVNTKDADTRADVYSLGCTLYFLLTGRAAYDGATVAAKLLAHHQQPIPDLRESKPDVPAQLEAVFERMVAKKVEDRYQAMSEVVRALEAVRDGLEDEVTAVWVADGQIIAGQTKAPTSLSEDVHSNKVKNRSAMIIAGLFATVAFSALGAYFIGSLKHDDNPTTSSTVVATAARLAAPDGPPPPAIAPFNATAARESQAAWAKYLGTTVETTNSVGMHMILVPPGKFLMGSSPEQTVAGRKMGEDDKLPRVDWYFSRLDDEMPQHQVTISQPLLMGSTEVTVAQFRKFVDATKYATEAQRHGFGNSADKMLSDQVKEADRGKNWTNPGYPISEDAAVTQITWNDAAAYCNWLSEHEQLPSFYRRDSKGDWELAGSLDEPPADTRAGSGVRSLRARYGYRLPTEAEWEYACRAGTTSQFSFGDDKSQLDQFGWFNKNAGGRVHSVASKRPNPFGLFDMHGNVQEWCDDWQEKSLSRPRSDSSSDSYRAVRGGSRHYSAAYCRCACRSDLPQSGRYYGVGFRCVRPW